MRSPAATVILPTRRRPDGLRAALESVFAQTVLKTGALHVLVADMDPEASACRVVSGVRWTAPEAVRLVYVHAPDAGLAAARNAALSATSTRFMAFLGDDQAAAPDWIARLLEAADACPSAVVFSPVVQRGQRNPACGGTTRFVALARAPGDIQAALWDLGRLPSRRPLFDTRLDAPAADTAATEAPLLSGLAAEGERFTLAPTARLLPQSTRHDARAIA